MNNYSNNGDRPKTQLTVSSHVQSVAVLGATGSIGHSALDVIAQHPDKFDVSILAAGTQVQALVQLCQKFHPKHAVIADPHLFPLLKQSLQAAGLATQAHTGSDVLDQLVASNACTTVIAAIVGAAGLSSTLAAAQAGKRILLANKESLVLAGELVMATARQSGAEIIPIDSEHNAIFQCLHSSLETQSVKRVILTASGGPFRGFSRSQLREVTREQAVRHPRWSMGAKISVDSASLMNKGLELIEAHHLFDLPRQQLDVLVHPQSLVHSLVEFIDGSTLAQLGLPDMRTSLAVGLGSPERIGSGVAGLDLLQYGKLEFEAPDYEAFPCLQLAWNVLERGGGFPAVLNAANEIAVAAFLHNQIPFLAIPELVENTLSTISLSAVSQPLDLATLLAIDSEARAITSAALVAFS